MKSIRKIIAIDTELCNGCGQCVVDCAEGAIQIISGKAKIVKDSYCDGLGACMGGCPTGALRIIEREAAPFDEAAALAYVASLKAQEQPTREVLGVPEMAGQALTMAQGAGCASRTTHSGVPWPIKLRLIPATAPFLQGGHLVLTADCAPAAAQDFHARYIQSGAIVLLACPKFEEQQGLIERFAAIIQAAQPKRLTALRMEVPCCQGLLTIFRQAAALAGYAGVLEEHVLCRDGSEQVS